MSETATAIVIGLLAAVLLSNIVVGVLLIKATGVSNAKLAGLDKLLVKLVDLIYRNIDVTYGAKSSADIGRGYSRDLHNAKFGGRPHGVSPISPDDTIPQEFTVKPMSQPPPKRRMPSDSGFREATPMPVDDRDVTPIAARGRQPSSPDHDEVLNRGRYPKRGDR